jgi:hypothetical protein
MNPIHLNHGAVWASIVIFYMIGGLWYSVLFQKPWLKLMKITPAELKKGGSPAMAMTGGFFATIPILYGLACLVSLTGAADAGHGACAGFLAWFSFVAPMMLNSVLYERRPIKLFAINVSYPLVGMLVCGAILAVWR